MKFYLGTVSLCHFVRVFVPEKVSYFKFKLFLVFAKIQTADTKNTVKNNIFSVAEQI